MKKSCLLLSDKAGEFPLRTRYLSLSSDIVRTSTPTPGLRVPVNVYNLSTPALSLSYFGCPRAPFESSTGGHLVIVLPDFDGRGGGLLVSWSKVKSKQMIGVNDVNDEMMRLM